MITHKLVFPHIYLQAGGGVDWFYQFGPPNFGPTDFVWFSVFPNTFAFEIEDGLVSPRRTGVRIASQGISYQYGLDNIDFSGSDVTTALSEIQWLYSSKLYFENIGNRGVYFSPVCVWITSQRPHIPVVIPGEKKCQAILNSDRALSCFMLWDKELPDGVDCWLSPGEGQSIMELKVPKDYKKLESGELVKSIKNLCSATLSEEQA